MAQLGRKEAEQLIKKILTEYARKIRSAKKREYAEDIQQQLFNPKIDAFYKLAKSEYMDFCIFNRLNDEGISQLLVGCRRLAKCYGLDSYDKIKNFSYAPESPKCRITADSDGKYTAGGSYTFSLEGKERLGKKWYEPHSVAWHFYRENPGTGKYEETASKMDEARALADFDTWDRTFLVSKKGRYKVTATIFNQAITTGIRPDIVEVCELYFEAEDKSNFENIIDDKDLTKLSQNSITKINASGKISYKIEYDRNIPILNFIDNDNKESYVIDNSKDLYRNFADALGVQDKIGNDELKEAMLDNKYCFVENVGWLKQSEYNQHLLGIREVEELSQQEYQYGIFNNLQIAIANHKTSYIDSLPEEIANESTKNKWKGLIKNVETTKDRFELKVMYKGSEKKLRVYYRIKGDDSTKIEILCIDAFSSVLNRKCPVGGEEQDKYLSVQDAEKLNKSVCKTTPNGKYYVPQKFPESSTGAPWHIISIDDLNENDDPVFIGPKKIRTDAYINVHVWEFKKENETDEKEKWIESGILEKDEGYLIHGGDGSFMNPEQFDTIDKGKGINRFKSTTRGCIRINNKDVPLLVELLTDKLPVEMEVSN